MDLELLKNQLIFEDENDNYFNPTTLEPIEEDITDDDETAFTPTDDIILGITYDAFCPVTFLTEQDIPIFVSFPWHLPFLVDTLKHHPAYQLTQLLDIAVIDLPNKQRRFTVSYIFRSLPFNQTAIVRTQLYDLDSLTSLNSLFNNATIYEREVWDIYGLHFTYHNYLHRILNDYGFLGYPLRKDFPLTGFYELQYSDLQKIVTKSKVELTQQYRIFTFSTAWQIGLITTDLDEEDIEFEDFDSEDFDLLEDSDNDEFDNKANLST